MGSGCDGGESIEGLDRWDAVRRYILTFSMRDFDDSVTAFDSITYLGWS